jgi:hypothetical protein
VILAPPRAAAVQGTGYPHDAKSAVKSEHVLPLSGKVEVGAPLSVVHAHTLVPGSQLTA